MTETLIEKLDALKCVDDVDDIENHAYNSAIEDAINEVRQHEAAQPQDVQELLRDMRMQVVWSDKATMPIPLYERMKAVITAMGESKSVTGSAVGCKPASLESDGSSPSSPTNTDTLSGYAREQETVFDWCAGHGFTPVTSEINDLLNLLRGGEK